MQSKLGKVASLLEESLLLLDTYETKENVSFEDALEVVLSKPYWAVAIADTNPSAEVVSTLITFENSNEIAYTLVYSDRTAAEALFEELAYHLNKTIKE